ncbi:methyltransferase domain-containing protein [Methylobrevis pamukkalensis]|uniref:Malonyl-[acyl-carrier protein] O-methyltransferase n=1 Tax=Methylobrevis pamukkalensis TaxID=1439726 RepID=A0A1E3GYD8_9HYPH|nr:methyltransferase domain-containing protein [Methylobrevis pamukkalensis]ODN69099.1 Malonyl-[acyl-carrier protein] O-methyltransferase [Methylobrevis pamukkalensis]
MTDAPRLFDRRTVAARRRRAIARGRPEDAFLVDIVAADVAERLATVSREFPTALAIGGPTDALARAVADSGRSHRVLRADLFAAGPDGAHPADLVVDDEVLPLAPASVDLVVSALTLQWANDLPGALVQIRRALKPDGLFLGVLVGGDSLTELRDAMAAAEIELTGGVSPRVAPMGEVRDMGALLQRAGFALPVADQDRLTLRYATPLHLMRELHVLGAGNALAERRRGLTPPALIGRAAEIYAERFSDPDGRVRATVTLVSLSGWAPHESQQKPLRPGTAKTRLADALKTTEIKI